MLFFNVLANLLLQSQNYLNTSNVILQWLNFQLIEKRDFYLNTSNVILQS